MKRRPLLWTMLIALAAAASALADDAAERVKLREVLMQREKDSWEMLRNKDVAALRDYYVDDAVLIFNDGTRFSKAEFLKITPEFKLDSYTIEGKGDVVVLTPDAATLVYRVTYASAIKDGKVKKVTVLSSSSYVRRGGKWLSVLYQETSTK